MANFNKVFLMGNLTRDPQLSYLPSQTPVCEIGLAVNRVWMDKEGQKKEETSFFDCSAFGRQAETISKYVKKGDPIFVEGRLKLDQWEAQDGSKRSKIRVVIEGFQFLPRAGARSAPGEFQPDGGGDARPAPAPRQYQPRPAAGRPAPQPPAPPPPASVHPQDDYDPAPADEGAPPVGESEIPF